MIMGVPSSNKKTTAKQSMNSVKKQQQSELNIIKR